MSTRAHITVKDSYTEIHFYRHSDGYPEHVIPILETFMDHVKEGRIRDDAEQAAGWLVVMGHYEYLEQGQRMIEKFGEGYRASATTPEPTKGIYGWKVGAFEPSVPEIHGDVEHVYTVDLNSKTVTHRSRY